MKLAVCSDLHLEFGSITLENTENADALILSGDICVAYDFSQKPVYLNFFEQVCGEFKDVFYVMGNHEHYHGDFAKSKAVLQDHLSHLENLHFLEKETYEIGDYVFVGGTLWTDMNGGDESTIKALTGLMNDFIVIKNSNRYVYRKVPLYKKDDEGNYLENELGQKISIGMKMKESISKFSPEDAMDDHKKFMQYLKFVLSEKQGKKFVVIGHHCPSKLSTHPRFEHQTLMNGGYSSSLDFFIEDHPEIVLWTHGHTHDKFDYKIGNTRVFCNPRGYVSYEYRADEFKLEFVDV
jgi:Icc-related predicted phosphoesterase